MRLDGKPTDFGITISDVEEQGGVYAKAWMSNGAWVGKMLAGRMSPSEAAAELRKLADSFERLETPRDPT